MLHKKSFVLAEPYTQVTEEIYAEVIFFRPHDTVSLVSTISREFVDRTSRWWNPGLNFFQNTGYTDWSYFVESSHYPRKWLENT